MRQAPLAYAALALSAAIWSGNAVIGRIVRDAVSPLAMAFWQWTIGIAVLLPFVWPELRARRDVLARSWRILAVLGALGTATFAAFALWSLRYTTATNYALLNSTIPSWVMLVMWLRHGERPTLAQVVGFCVSVAGVFVVLARGEWEKIIGLQFAYGDVLALASMIMWSVYTALLNERPRELSVFAFIVATGIVGVSIVAPLYAIDAARGVPIATVDPTRFIGAIWIGIAYLVLLRTIAATVTYNYGVGVVGATRAAPFIHLVPVFGAIAATSILDERIGSYHFIGFVLVVTGIAIAEYRRRAR